MSDIDIYKEFHDLEDSIREKFSSMDAEPFVKMIKAAYLVGGIHCLGLADDHDATDVMMVLVEEALAMHRETK